MSTQNSAIQVLPYGQTPNSPWPRFVRTVAIFGIILGATKLIALTMGVNLLLGPTAYPGGRGIQGFDYGDWILATSWPLTLLLVAGSIASLTFSELGRRVMVIYAFGTLIQFGTVLAIRLIWTYMMRTGLVNGGGQGIDWLLNQVQPVALVLMSALEGLVFPFVISIFMRHPLVKDLFRPHAMPLASMAPAESTDAPLAQRATVVPASTEEGLHRPLPLEYGMARTRTHDLVPIVRLMAVGAIVLGGVWAMQVMLALWGSSSRAMDMGYARFGARAELGPLLLITFYGNGVAGIILAAGGLAAWSLRPQARHVIIWSAGALAVLAGMALGIGVFGYVMLMPAYGAAWQPTMAFPILMLIVNNLHPFLLPFVLVVFFTRGAVRRALEAG